MTAFPLLLHVEGDAALPRSLPFPGVTRYGNPRRLPYVTLPARRAAGLGSAILHVGAEDTPQTRPPMYPLPTSWTAQGGGVSVTIEWAGSHAVLSS
jgi:hypothetical protein